MDYKPGTVTLSNGRELKIDLRKVTQREWRQVFDPEVSRDVNDPIIAKIVGITAAELVELDMIDFRRVMMQVMADAQDPFLIARGDGGGTAS